MAGLGADWLMRVGTAYSMTGRTLRAKDPGLGAGPRPTGSRCV